MPDVKLSSSWTGKSTYHGCFRACGRRNGFGAENWRNQEQKYEGRFFCDAFHGEGVYQWLTGNERLVFEGQFYSNFKEGYGLVSLPDGSLFEGLFCNNRPFGPGVQTYVNGRQDVGFWCGERIVRLSRSVDFIIPRLASTSDGKLKLLRFQTVVPFMEEEADVAAALFIKNGLDPSQSHRLYSDLIHDPRSMFFNRPHSDSVYFVKVNQLDSRSDSSQTFIRGNSWNTTCISGEEECLVASSANDGAQSSTPPEKEESTMGVLRFYTTHRTLDGYPAEFPGNENWKSAAGSAGKFSVDSDSATESEVTQLLSWNRSQLCMEMLKQIFRFRASEEKLTFKISDLMTGTRTKFRKTGEKERVALHFLRMCSIGPAYIVKDLLCSKNISEALMDSRGNNSIMFAAATDQHDVIDLLLNYGADVNSFNDESLTPLNFCLLRRIAEAASIGNWEVSFLAPERSVPADGVHTKRCQMMESVASLDRIFGDGTSAEDNETLHIGRGNSQVNSLFSFDGEITQHSRRNVTLFGNEKNLEEEEEERVEISRMCLISHLPRNSYANEQTGKQEEYLRSVAEPTERDKYFFDLSSEKNGRLKEEHFILAKNVPSKEGTFQRDQSKGLNEVDEKKLIKINERISSVERTIEQLLRRGADPNVGDAPKPSLHLAVYSNEVHLVRLLLTYGAAPDSHTLPQEGLLTPLHVIVLMKPRQELVTMSELLLNHGASPEEETAPDFTPNGENDSLLDPERGRTPLQLLCTRRDAEYADAKGFLRQLALLLVRVSKRGNFFSGHSYLTLAMISGNYSLAEALLTSKRVDPNEVLERDLGTALHVLVSAELQRRTPFEDSIRMCDLLLKHGADPTLEFRTHPSLAGTCVDYGYREIERERMREQTDGSEAIESDGRNYLENYRRLVEYLGKGANSEKNEGGSRKKIIKLSGAESHHNRGPGRRKTKDDNGGRVDDDKATERRTMGRSDEKGDEKEGVRKNGKQQQQKEGSGAKRIKSSQVSGKERRGDSDQTVNGETKIIEIKKHVKNGKGAKPEGGKDRKGKVKKGRNDRKETAENELEKTNVSKGTRNRKGPVRGVSETLPERFCQSLIHMFGICGERLDLNDFLLPYVVLRNGDLYYRFKGRKPPGTEQYSLI